MRLTYVLTRQFGLSVSEAEQALLYRQLFLNGVVCTNGYVKARLTDTVLFAGVSVTPMLLADVSIENWYEDELLVSAHILNPRETADALRRCNASVFEDDSGRSWLVSYCERPGVGLALYAAPAQAEVLVRKFNYTPLRQFGK